jgi:GntR family transcriptional repressor for pyruvate dehydrogenase complex
MDREVDWTDRKALRSLSTSRSEQFDQVSLSPPETLPRAIAAELRRRIAAGELKPGDRLPGHRELAGAFSVSVSSVREAISMLVSSGLIETRAARGTFVTDLPLLSDGLAPIERKEAGELLEARELLELQLVELAATRASASQLQTIRRAVDRLADAVDTAAGYNEADRLFHGAIAEAAGNRFLRRALDEIRTRIQPDLDHAADAAIRRFGSLDFSLAAHRELVDAIEAGEAVESRRQLHVLMARSHEFILGLYALAPVRTPAAATADGAEITR